MLPAWRVQLEGSGRTVLGPGQSEVHTGDPGGCGTGGGGPWPCRTLSASPPSLCVTQSKGGRRSFWLNIRIRFCLLFYIKHRVWHSDCTAEEYTDEELNPHAVRCTQPWRKHELHPTLLFHTLQTELSLRPTLTHTRMHTHILNCKLILIIMRKLFS